VLVTEDGGAGTRGESSRILTQETPAGTIITQTGQVSILNSSQAKVMMKRVFDEDHHPVIFAEQSRDVSKSTLNMPVG